MKFAMGIWIVVWLSVWYVSNIYFIDPGYILLVGYLAGLFSMFLTKEYKEERWR